eukprot:CAMPEP_0184294516 /NCGR_PEP_ID=MMETSP1049-20130417/5695_1 /TAXON_ID=77928 /ORGANISM="Proteomonas sulcata, Strain CCMP704" /LENGTH=141 /DNA_ID=CAMNT_0026602837 /DNA_START=262 /DNA_END=687 /DNA_ORIENTATION=-
MRSSALENDAQDAEQYWEQLLFRYKPAASQSPRRKVPADFNHHAEELRARNSRTEDTLYRQEMERKKAKDAWLEMQRMKKEHEEMSKCTFKPVVSQPRRCTTPRDSKSPGRSLTPGRDRKFGSGLASRSPRGGCGTDVRYF